MEKKDFLTPVLNISQNKTSENLTIINSQIGNSMHIFSLYGLDIERFYMNLLQYRAIDQKTTADIAVKEIFQNIIQPNAKMDFNLIITPTPLQKHDENSNLNLEKSDEEKSTHKKHAEIDVAIKMNVYPFDGLMKSHTIEPDYCFIELKMFTAPIEQRDKALISLIQDKPLMEYFKLRHLYGVIGSSYLSYSDETNNEPVPSEQLKQEGIKHLIVWITHLVLMDSRVLDEYPNAVVRSRKILEQISKDQRRILTDLAYDPKKFKFKLIYNILKVIGMSQTIAQLRNEIKELKMKLQTVEEETRKRVEEETRKRVEEETRKRVEEETRKRVEEEFKKKYGIKD